MLQKSSTEISFLSFQSTPAAKGEGIGGWDTSNLWTCCFLLKHLKVFLFASKKDFSYKSQWSSVLSIRYPRQPKVDFF